MYQLFYVMHMDIDEFGSLSLHWVSKKLEITLIVTPNDNRMVEIDAKLSEEFLMPKCMSSDVDHSSIPGLY
jgi:hypothetical protein